MKTTLDLPDDLVRRIKIRAVHESKPLKRLVAELLNQGLNGVAPPTTPHPLLESVHLALNERGFPVIRCGPNVPAAGMTAEQLVELEQQALLEEDMQRAGIAH